MTNFFILNQNFDQGIFTSIYHYTMINNRHTLFNIYNNTIIAIIIPHHNHFHTFSHNLIFLQSFCRFFKGVLFVFLFRTKKVSRQIQQCLLDPILTYYIIPRRIYLINPVLYSKAYFLYFLRLVRKEGSFFHHFSCIFLPFRTRKIHTLLFSRHNGIISVPNSSIIYTFRYHR